MCDSNREHDEKNEGEKHVPCSGSNLCRYKLVFDFVTSAGKMAYLHAVFVRHQHEKNKSGEKRSCNEVTVMEVFYRYKTSVGMMVGAILF